MDRVGEVASLREEEIEQKVDLEVAINEYGRRVGDFLSDLEEPASNYELMLASQRYLLAAADLLSETSGILGLQVMSMRSSLFEAAAWAYLDSKDLSAYIHNLDGRFILDDRNSRFVRSRLKAIALRASRIWQSYRREIDECSSPGRSSLKLLLEVFLDLPVSAWEFAPCLAMKGDCKGCGYASDHGRCAEPGSAYDMLSRSRLAILTALRSSLSCDLSRSMICATKQRAAQIETPDTQLKLALTRIETGLCGEYEVVESCD